MTERRRDADKCGSANGAAGDSTCIKVSRGPSIPGLIDQFCAPGSHAGPLFGHPRPASESVDLARSLTISSISFSTNALFTIARHIPFRTFAESHCRAHPLRHDGHPTQVLTAMPLLGSRPAGVPLRPVRPTRFFLPPPPPAFAALSPWPHRVDFLFFS